MPAVRAIVAALVATPDITTDLATYDFGAGDASAIFAVDPAPENAVGPLIVVSQVGGAWEIRARDRSASATDCIVDVKVWGDKDDSDKILRGIAWDVWRALDRLIPAQQEEGWEVFNFRCAAPVRLADPDGFPGYTIQVTAAVRMTPRAS